MTATTENATRTMMDPETIYRPILLTLCRWAGTLLVMPSHFEFREFPLERLVPHSDHEPVSFDTVDDERLCQSIESIGVLVPLLVEEESLRIVDGHRRYLAAKHLGFPAVPCVVGPQLNSRDYELVRFSLRFTCKPWTQTEYAAWRRKAKRSGIAVV